MCRTTQWRLTQTESSAVPSPARSSAPSTVGDGKGLGRFASPKPVPSHRDEGRASGAGRHRDRAPCQGRIKDHLQVAVQAPVAGMPVRPGIGEVDRVNQRRVGVGAEQQRPFCVHNQEAKATACSGLTMPEGSHLAERDREHDRAERNVPSA